MHGICPWNLTHRILWIFEIQTKSLNPGEKTRQFLSTRIKNRYLLKFIVQTEDKVKTKVSQKDKKYLHLSRYLKKWNMRNMVIHKCLEK